MLAANVLFLDYPLAKVPDTYPRVLHAWRFELMFTAGVTSLWLVAKEELARRRLAERSLQDAFEAQRALVDAAPIAIVGVTAGGVVSAWNPAAEALFGRAAAEAIGDAAPAMHRAGDAPVIDAVLGGEVLARTEGEALLSGGSRVPVAISGAPVRDPAGAVLLVEDLRERRSLEAAVERAASMSALGQLVGGVAHELRNPLFGVSATLDAFARELAGSPKLQLMDRTLRGQVEQLRSLMHDLLAYGRAGLGERAEASVELPLGHALRDCEAQAAAAEVAVVVALPPGLPTVSINAAQVQQVLRNLLQNAIAFSRPGGAVRIEGQREDEGRRAWVRIDVLDRGPGFAPDDLPRVFEPFFSRRHGGTGLGLAIVQHVVERHGGTVTAGNRADGGACMVVRLPACPGTG
jgi:PAS domain S-box-containing protein